MKLSDIFKSFLSVNTKHYNSLKTNSLISHLSEINSDQLYSIVHKESEPIFVLSTGRCGTLLLTNILSKVPTFNVHHEPSPEFVWHNKYAFEKFDSKPSEIAMMFDVARYEIMRSTYLEGKTYIETNNRVTFFAHQIAEIYPKAKFIHLMREPISFIKSGASRNWYSGKEIYDEGRIIDVNSSKTWDEYTTIEKIAWLWGATNDFILKFSNKYPNRVFQITSSQLFNDYDKLQQMLSFLNSSHLDSSQLKKLTKKPINKSRSLTIITDQDLEKIKSILSNFQSYQSYSK